jgi:hypothetical protein
MDNLEKRSLQILLFSVSQLSDEKKYDIPVFLFGNVAYDVLLENKNVIKYQEYLFKGAWQMFFDCIISDDYRRVLKNQLIVFTTILLTKNV